MGNRNLVRGSVLGMVLLFGAEGFAQTRTAEPIVIGVASDSGHRMNPTDSRAAVWTERVLLPMASSYRLRFADVVLSGPGDAIVIRSPADGEVQRLDLAELGRWGYQSAWMNGDAVDVSLELGDGSTGRVRVEAATIFAAAPGEDDICGSDNRVPSSDNRSFRLILSGISGGGGWCTGWLYGPTSTYLTAGHCYGGIVGPSSVAQFNVPTSTASGALVMPPVADQFPSDLSVLQFDDGGEGNDWAVARLHPNSAGSNAALLHGFFTPATVLVTTSVTGRMTGFGSDSTPDPSRNGTQQTSTGGASIFGFRVTHSIDSEPGNSGGPILIDGLDYPYGIHTHGGCGTFTSNGGTAIGHPGLQAAITAVAGCGSVHLQSGGTATVSCSPAIFSGVTTPFRWNVAAVSSTSNWDIEREGVVSSRPNGLCDFLISNGNLGSIPPFSSTVTRRSGTDSARVQLVAAEPMALGTAATSSWTSSRIIRAYQIPVPGGVTSLDVTVVGDSSLRWVLYRPDAGIGSAWRPRSANESIAFGVVGAGTVASIPVTVTGTYGLVVYRDGGAAALTIPTLSVGVCASGGAPVALPVGTPTTVTPACAQLAITPTQSTWNVVGATSSGQPFGVSAGGASSDGNGTTTEFVAANAHLGFLANPFPGATWRQLSLPAHTVQHVPATPVTTGSISGSLPAGHVLAAYGFNVAQTAPQDFLVTGDPSLSWYLFDVGTDQAWRGKSTALTSGTVGGNGLLGFTMPPGVYGVVIVRNAGISAQSHGFSIRLGPSSSRVTLSGPGTSVSGLLNPSYLFRCTPAASRWNAVGIYGTLTSGWTVAMGNVTQATGNNSTGYLLANGHLGAISPVDGLLLYNGMPLSHGSPGFALHQAAITTVGVGSSATTPWDTTRLLHVFEFDVPSLANYDLSVFGSGGLSWSVFGPGSGSAWLPRSQAIATSGVGTPLNAVPLQPGWHAIVVSRGFGTVNGTSLTCTVTPSQNPVPTITSLTPNAVLSGSFGATVTIDGSGFAPTATVQWEAQTALTVLSRSPTQITVAIPQSLLARPGSFAITVTNPAPAGGTSAPSPFTVLPPHLTTLTPSIIPPMTLTDPPILLTIDGANFQSFATVTIDGVGLPTTVVNSGRIMVFLDPTRLRLGALAGLAVTVANDRFALSNTLALQIAPGARNRGTTTRSPLVPNPGESYAAVIEGGPVGQPFAWIADLSIPTPIPHFPNPTGDFLLGVGTPGTTLPLLDGIGLFGPATPGITFGSDPNFSAGVFRFPGLTWPTTPVNLTFSLQTLHLDPSEPLGFAFGWIMIEDV